MDDEDAYIEDVMSNVVSKPRSSAAAAARMKALANNVLISGRVTASLRTKCASGDPWEVGGAIPACDDPNDRTHQLPSNWTRRLPAK
jgi:hypothetical protein